MLVANANMLPDNLVQYGLMAGQKVCRGISHKIVQETVRVEVDDVASAFCCFTGADRDGRPISVGVRDGKQTKQARTLGLMLAVAVATASL